MRNNTLELKLHTPLIPRLSYYNLASCWRRQRLNNILHVTLRTIQIIHFSTIFMCLLGFSSSLDAFASLKPRKNDVSYKKNHKSARFLFFSSPFIRFNHFFSISLFLSLFELLVYISFVCLSCSRGRDNNNK